jgi:hypothetical protein
VVFVRTARERFFKLQVLVREIRTPKHPKTVCVVSHGIKRQIEQFSSRQMKPLRRQSEQEMVGSRTPECSIRVEKTSSTSPNDSLLGFLLLVERVGFANEGSYLVILRVCQVEMWHHEVLRRSSVFNVIRSISYAKCHLVRNSFEPLPLANSFHWDHLVAPAISSSTERKVAASEE